MKKIYIILTIFALLLSAILFFWSDLSKLYKNLLGQWPKIEIATVEQLNKVIIDPKVLEAFIPPPLRSSQKESQSLLTQAGVIKYTNLERVKNDLPALKENAKLDISAEIKVEDMFKQQYFTHESPTGISVSDLAKTAGYNFIAIGENIALGNFKDDFALVEAWMNSPGHRENILNPKYQEIGVSVIKGTFEGETTWMAVQHFGMPKSACPKIDQTLKKTIDANQVKLQEMMAQIKILESELNNGRGKQENIIQDYNALVTQYNNLIDENQKMIDQYNQEILLFNECLDGVK